MTDKEKGSPWICEQYFSLSQAFELWLHIAPIMMSKSALFC